MRKVAFSIGEYYHIYNRGTEKRVIFSDENDIRRFFRSMSEFNTPDPIGSIYEHSFLKKELLGGSTSKSGKEEKLVNFVAYCLNPNHYHFILEPLIEKGIEKFMQRLGTGFTMYFNKKYERSGALFQGRFKSVHVSSNEFLLHLSAYINLNDRVHQLGGPTSKLVRSRSSWQEYVKKGKAQFCHKASVLGQFRNSEEYRTFAEESLKGTLERRAAESELAKILFE